MKRGVKAAARRRRENGVAADATAADQTGFRRALRPMAIGALILYAAVSFGLLGPGPAHAQDRLIRSVFAPVFGGLGHVFAHLLRPHPPARAGPHAP